MNTHRRKLRIGADVGGTFTDVLLMDSDGKIWTQKVPSTPPDFERAVLDASELLLRKAESSGDTVSQVAHGTTVATNAVLEHRGAKTALITTRGFRDVLELRRIRAPQIYDLFFDKPAILVERYLRFEVTERIAVDGEILIPLQAAELEAIFQHLETEAVESIAVCFLHAYAFPQHEIAVGERLRQRFPRMPISLSHEVLPERKEYERTATTVVNAYVRPIMRGYLGNLRSGLSKQKIEAPLHIMQSAGGLTPDDDAELRPVFMLESGPAAGVLAAGFTARRMGVDNLITLDMGGTTAKASMVENGRIDYSPEYEVGSSLSIVNRLVGGGGELIRAPSIDIAEVGAGGGSIAYLDSAGGLRVGPRSAGAIPGPVCYQRGGKEPTLTDANVVLGYIRPGDLADGEVSIDREAAVRAIVDQIANPLGMDLIQAAEGIHRIGNARTMRALRAVSTERGRDPRRFILMGFGGSGPIHAAGLAAELGISRVIIPPLPGLFSALGLLFSGIEHHDVRSCLLSGDGLNPASVSRVVNEMRSKMLQQFDREGFMSGDVELDCECDMRFRGQTSEIRLDLVPDQIDDRAISDLRRSFTEEHEQLYGHRSDPDNPIEVVAVRLIGRAGVPDREGAMEPAEYLGVAAAHREACFAGAVTETPIVTRRDLKSELRGPLLVDEYDSTIVIPPDASAHLDEFGNIVMELSNA
jgi:N-methylhydantoinase A